MVKKGQKTSSMVKTSTKSRKKKQKEKDNQDKENALGTIISLGIVIWLIYQIPGCFSYDCHDEAVKVRMCTYELDDYVNHNEKGLKKYKECVKMYRKWENKCVSKEKREKYKALDDNFFFLK